MGDLLDDNDPFEEDIHFDQAGLLGGKAVRTKHYHNAVGFLPTFMLFSRTVFLCIAFTGLGMCSSITHNPVIKVQQWLGVPEWEALHTFTAHSIGALVGGLLGSKLFDVYNRQFLVFLALVWVSISVAVLPFTLPISLWWMRTTLVAVSAGIAFLFTGGNVLCLDIWGRQGGGGALQALHFSFALGAFIAPVIIHPFFSGQQSEGLSSTSTVLPSTVPHSILEPLSGDLESSALIRLPRFLHTTPRYNFMALSDSDILALTQAKVNNSTFQSVSPGRDDKIPHREQTVFSNETFNTNGSSWPFNSVENDTDIIAGRQTGKVKISNLDDDSTNSTVSLQYSDVITGLINDQGSPSFNSTPEVNKVDIILNNPKPARPKPSFTGATVKEQQPTWKRLPPKKLSTPEQENVVDESASDADTGEEGKEGHSSESVSPSEAHSAGSTVVDGLNNTVESKPSVSTQEPEDKNLHHAEGSSNSTGPSSVSNSAPPVFEMSDVISDDHQKYYGSKLTTMAPNIYSSIESKSHSSAPSDMFVQPANELAPTTTTTTTTTSALFASSMDGANFSVKSQNSSPVLDNVEHLITETELSNSTPPILEMDSLSDEVSPVTSVQEALKLAPKDHTSIHAPSVIPPTTTYSNIKSSRTNGDIQLEEMGRPDEAVHLEQSNFYPNRSHSTDQNDASHLLLPVLEPKVQDLKESQSKKPLNVAPIAEMNDNITNTTGKVADASNIFHSIVGLLKKPGTFSNLTENHNKFIENIAKKFQGYGVTKIHLAFICISIFVMLNSLVFVVILCHNPREPRSKQEKGFLDHAPHSKYNFFLVFFSLFMFTAEALQGAIHHLLASNSETNGLSILDKGFDGPALFWGLVCIIRFLCIMLSGCIHLKPGKILGVSTFFTSLGTVFLCIGSFDKDDFMWSGIILASIGLAPTLPTSLLWMSQHMLVTHKMCAIMIILTSLGNSLTHGGLAYVASKSHFYTYILVGLSLASVVLLVLSWFIIYTAVGRASSHLMSPNAGNELTTSEGYRLARQHEEDDSDGMEMQGQSPRPRQETDQHRQLLHDHHLASSSQADPRMFLYQEEGALLID